LSFSSTNRGTIGPLDNVLLVYCWEQFVADDAVDHRFDFTPRQPIDRERGSHPASIQGGSNSAGTSRSQNAKVRTGPQPARTFQLVGSANGASRRFCSTGLWRVSASSCAVSASSVFCLPAAGLGQARGNVRRSRDNIRQ